MAKTFSKHNQGSANDFLIQHVEKIGFGIACVLVGVFVWLGLKSPRYENTTPQSLFDTAAVKAKDHINNPSSWDRLEATRDADTKAAERIANDVGKIDSSVYPFGPLSGAIFATLAKRSDPEMIAVRDFQTEFIRTQIATKVPPNSREQKMILELNKIPAADDIGLDGMMRYWMFAYRPQKNGLNETTHLAMTYDIVVGTGLIPFAEQRQKYRDQFLYAEGWHLLRDQPIYKHLQVQRSEDGGQTWVDINHEIDRRLSLFAAPAKEVIQSDYVVDGITHPIPPLLSYDYREIAGHELIPFQRMHDEELMASKSTEDEPDTERPSMFDQDIGAETEDTTEPKKEPAKYRLARFFDPTPKQIGKTYQYRIRAWVVDPNTPNFVKAVTEDKKRGGPGEIAGPAGGGAGGLDEVTGPGRGQGKGKDKDPEDYLTDEEREALKTPPVPITEVMLAKSVRDRLRIKRTDYPKGISEELANQLANAIPTPWSEISEVTIPRNFARFYAGPVKSRLKSVSSDSISYQNEEYEDTVNVVAVTSTPQLDVSIPIKNDNAFRGSILNFNSIAKFLHPITWEVKELHEYVNTSIDYKEDRRLKIFGKFFQTDALLLDILGGERMPFSSPTTGVFTKPSEVLIMDSNGRLIVRNELNDATNYRISTFAGDDEELDAELARREAERAAKEREDRGRGGGGDDIGGGGR